MDGLECNIIYLSTLERTLRIDAEFYEKENLQVLSCLDNNVVQPFTESFSILDGNHMSIREFFCNVGIPYYRCHDIYNVFIEEASAICIDKYTFNQPYMKRSHLQRGDVLLSIVGTVGKSAIVSLDAHATCSCKLAIIRSKQKNINPETLLVFLKTKYGNNQIQKFKRGTIQTGLLLEDFNQLLLPQFSSKFQNEIKSTIQLAHNTTVNKNEIYNTTKNYLLSKFQFDTTTMSTSNITEKNLSESFFISGRLDAEYYQPKYDDLFALLDTNETVGSLCRIYDCNFVPDADSKYQYIELANVNLHGVISEVDTLIGKELPARARRQVKAGQVIVSSIEGSLQSCALITDEYDGALCSTGFYVLDSDKINSETLFMLFKSEPIQELLKQRCSGTILTAISKDEFLKIPLPLIKNDIQLEIANKVQESFALRRKAEELIQIAVKAVEIAIETDEEQAIAYIKENTQ